MPSASLTVIDGTTNIKFAYGKNTSEKPDVLTHGEPICIPLEKKVSKLQAKCFEKLLQLNPILADMVVRIKTSTTQSQQAISITSSEIQYLLKNSFIRVSGIDTFLGTLFVNYKNVLDGKLHLSDFTESDQLKILENYHRLKKAIVAFSKKSLPENAPKYYQLPGLNTDSAEFVLIKGTINEICSILSIMLPENTEAIILSEINTGIRFLLENRSYPDISRDRKKVLHGSYFHIEFDPNGISTRYGNLYTNSSIDYSVLNLPSSLSLIPLSFLNLSFCPINGSFFSELTGEA